MLSRMTPTRLAFARARGGDRVSLCFAPACVRRLSSNNKPGQTQLGQAVGDGGNADAESLASSTGNTAASRPKLRLGDLLSNKRSGKFTFPMDKTVGEAISHLVEENMGSSLAVDSKGELSGIFTARDILRFLHTKGAASSYFSGSSSSMGGKEKALSCKVKDIMVKKDKLIFCSPSDTVRRCRETMFQHKIRTVPVLEGGEVLGIITNKDLSDSAFTAVDAGGKKHFLETASGRRGLPDGTRIRESSQSSSKTASRVDVKLALESAAFSMPHPYKKTDGCAQGRRDYGPQELCSDDDLCEDAHFVVSVKVPSKKGTEVAEQTYLCVADGVGSWRQYGVDPREYSHRLVDNAKKVIESDALQRNLISDASAGLDGFNLFDSEPIHPLDVLVDAWTLTTAERVTGSSTICVATLDSKLNQLSYSNLGDCGLLVLRHIDSETAGYMRYLADRLARVGVGVGVGVGVEAGAGGGGGGRGFLFYLLPICPIYAI